MNTTLFGNGVFADLTTGGPYSNMDSPYKKREIWIQASCPGQTKTEIGGTQLQAKECQGCWPTPKAGRETWNRSLRRKQPCQPLDLGLPASRNFCCLRPPVCGTSLQQPEETNAPPSSSGQSVGIQCPARSKNQDQILI